MRRRPTVLALLALLAAAAPALAQPAPQRVILRLADGAARARLMAEAGGAPFTLEARHAHVVTGLRAIHAAAVADAGPAIARARAAGAYREIDRLWAANAIVAEVDPAWIPALEADPAIAGVEPDRRLTPGGIAVPGTSAAVADATADLIRIGVDQVWAQGIIGQGAIVANVDSGVNGEDDTLEDRWRGRYAGSDATWFAPTALTVFPEDDGGIFSFGHGTATMGVLTGGEAEFGVAYGATWIAGDIFEQNDGFVSGALRVLEWLIDPDGDPSSTTDVPDVVNNSYGLRDLDPGTGRIRCDTIFNAAIDALEAAGVIVIWSAGNEGGQGVTSPANRARSPVDAFSVGAVGATDAAIASSGRGPSACGGTHQVKPEVVAPGSAVRTRNRFNASFTATGTSFATPMVGGVLALMRSKNPTLTPEAAKTILIQTADDLGAAGNDNETGHGLVNAVAALAAVQRPSQPLARLVGYRPVAAVAGKLAPAGIEDALILRPGAAHSLAPLLTNHGPAMPATTGRLTSATPGVTVARPTVALEAAATGAFFGPAAGGSFGVDLAGSVPPGTPIVLDLAVEGAAVGPFRLIVRAGQPIPGDFATHDEGQVRFSVTNFGAFGYYTGLHGSGFVLEGAGFRWPPSSPSWLFHAAFMAGTGPTRLSDGIPYGEDTQGASDWIPVFGFPIQVDAAAGGQRISVAYDDRKAPTPLGIEVRQESFAFGDAGAEDFVFVHFIVRNRTGSTIGGLRFGVFADWDLPDASGVPSETGHWDPTLRLGWVESGRAGQPAVGVAWLDAVPGGQVTFHVLPRAEALESPLGNPDLAPAAAPDIFEGELSDAEKWAALTSGQSRTSVTQSQDLYTVIGVGPVSLAAGAVDTVAVAFVAGSTRDQLRQNAEAARTEYFERVLGTAPPPPPDPPTVLALEQNFPNPFRVGSATSIVFAVPDGIDGPAEVAVYDALGRRVRTLARDLGPGEQGTSWDGRDATGGAVPPGVYVVRLAAGGDERTVRVLVLP